MTKYIACLLAMAFLVAAGVFSINAWLDPNADWAYLRGDSSMPPKDLNHQGEVKYKSAMLRALPPNSIKVGIFGNSRVGMIDPAQIPINGIAVNLALPGSTISQIQQFIRTARERHNHLRPIIGISFDQCFKREPGPMTYLLPYVDFNSAIDALKRLLSIKTLYRGIWSSVDPRAMSETEIGRYGNIIRHFDFSLIGEIKKAIEIDLKIYRSYIQKINKNFNCYSVLKNLKQEFANLVLFINPQVR